MNRSASSFRIARDGAEVASRAAAEMLDLRADRGLTVSSDGDALALGFAAAFFFALIFRSGSDGVSVARG